MMIGMMALWLSGLDAAVAGEQEPARFDLDTAQSGASISPLLFGQNIEITRKGICQGLSAEMVANRKFAASERNGLPKRWTVIGSGGDAAIDDLDGFAGKQSLRVEINDPQKFCGLAQAAPGMAFKNGSRYTLRIWAKSEAPRTIKASLFQLHGWGGNVTGSMDECPGRNMFFQKEWPAGPGEWQCLETDFTTTATYAEARLEIVSQGAGVFRIGAVSLQPSQTLNGLRTDVVDLLKQLKPGGLRWPGGCYAEYFRWKDGLLPVDRRPPIGPTGLVFLLPENDDYDLHEVGIDEFIALCRAVGAEPAITVRLSENTPQDAADLVEYCNGGADTQWGKVRAERGHAEPYGVKDWFVGNELYYFGRGEASGAEGCARQTKLFADAMKAKDPTIRLSGCTTPLVENWNKPLIAQAGDKLEMIDSVHLYGTLTENRDLSVVAKAATDNLRPFLEKCYAGFQREVPAGRRCGLVMDEWNLGWGLQGNVEMGLHVAGVLNLFCREATAFGLERAYYFMPVNEGAIKVRPLDASLDTPGLVFAMFSAHQGNQVLTIPITQPGADLDLCASLSPSHDQLIVTAVNRNLESTRTVELALHNFAVPFEATAKLLVPQSLSMEERDFSPVTQEPKVLDGRRVQVTIPPCSVACVRCVKAQ